MEMTIHLQPSKKIQQQKALREGGLLNQVTCASRQAFS